ncbi:MAG TPA: hypothetical protein VGM81_25990 [Burkholderiaceae bacterium]
MLIFYAYNGGVENQHHQLMLQRKPLVINDDSQVRLELRKLGLTVEIVNKIARQAAAAKAEALEIDPSSTPGTLAYIFGVRAIRLELLKVDGWRMSRAGNVESTVNDELGIQICFQNVDTACTEHIPQAISGKGAGSRKLIQDGQVELFDREAPEATDAIGSAPTVWVICVSTDGKKLRAEVSCPEAFEGNQFEGFSKRIWVVDEDLAPAPDRIDRPDDGEGPVEHEVRIAKK